MDSVQIPGEIIEEILVKLPVKSIVRFECVCKSWFNLMKSSRFVYKHLIESDESFPALCFWVREANNRQSYTRRFSAVFRYDDDVDQEETRVHEGVMRLINRQHDEQEAGADYMLPMFNFELPSSFRGSFPDLVGHCNGILCFTDHESIMLVNPSLKEMKTLPIQTLVGYDRLEYCRSVGFGFDNMTMDFKVVTILSPKHWNGYGEQGAAGRRRQRAEVYSVRSRSWRKLDVCPNNYYYYSIYCSTFLNGVVHWCARTRHSGSRLLTFDMATELFEEIEFPLGVAKDDEAVSLFVLNQDSLALISYPNFPFKIASSSDFVDVWTIYKHKGKTKKEEEEGETRWTKLYSIGHLNQFQRPICFWKKNKLFYTTTTRKLISYDLIDQSSSVVWSRSHDEHGKHDLTKVRFQVGICKSTLVSINM